jgi:hypothetical protein
MSYDDKVRRSVAEVSKSLYDLLQILGDIDESDPANEQNEWSITDDNGDKIILAYKPQTSELTITRSGLKPVNIKVIRPRRKIHLVVAKTSKL